VSGGLNNMSIIGKTFEKAIARGQESTKAHMEKLQELLETVIENENEIMLQQKKICEKLDVQCKLEY